MTNDEFQKKYNFHDSLIDNINYNNSLRELTIVFDFAYWMQDWYNEDTQPETGPLTVLFKGIYDFSYNFDLNEISVLELVLSDSFITFNILNDSTDESYELKLEPIIIEVLD